MSLTPATMNIVLNHIRSSLWARSTGHIAQVRECTKKMVEDHPDDDTVGIINRLALEAKQVLLDLQVAREKVKSLDAQVGEANLVLEDLEAVLSKREI